MPENFSQVLIGLGVVGADSEFLAVFAAIVAMVVISFSLFFIAKSLVMPRVRQFVNYIKPSFVTSVGTPLVKLSNRLAWLLPCLFCLVSLSWFIPERMIDDLALYKVLYIYMYFNIALVLTSLLTIVGIMYHRQTYAKNIPIEGFVQIIKLAVFIVLTVLTMAELMNKTPLYLLSSLGALTAILLLVFKDTILGLVAGIQIATHRLVTHGDWIEMQKFGADGEVLEVGLHTVKVKNWDNTFTNIPTTSLIHDSFKNWRGMSESTGRRIKRSIHINIKDIKIINEQQKAAMMASFGDEFAEFCHQRSQVDTNIGLFREYCEFYLHQQPLINKEMLLLARQLQPNEFGIPVELYCFCLDKNFVPYEKLQAQIFEHLLAVLHVFELRAYQRPSEDVPTLL